ncbi:hypothetical protein AB0M54_39825 [Actinoplanes sp. NPDC051470]|uniref:hypothetical protein n=1 Tax=unclassified Actinoplanes TaxID=2626549 RepID=UPI003437E72B
MRRLAVTATALLLALPTTALASSAAAAGAPAVRTLLAPADTGKYYVVGPPVNGRREYLFAIAATTLGDGNRYQEIFELNRGRVQPDGQTMTDSTRVEPGWILMLPTDAKGPRVVSGALPVPSSPPRPSVPVPAPSRPSASPSTPPPDRAAPPESADDGPSGFASLWSPTGSLVVVAALAVLFVAWTGMVRFSRRRSARAASAARLPSPVAATPATPPGTSWPTRGTPPSPPAIPLPTRIPTRAVGAFTEPAGPRPAPITAIPAQRGTPRTAPAPASPPDPFAALVTDLMCAAEPASVRLIGARPGRWGAAYGWLEKGRPPPSAAPVIAGERDGRRLWIDLAMAPDVLTVGGSSDAVRRHARALVMQLGEDTDVVVAGDTIGDDLPARWRRVDTVEQVPPGRAGAAARFVVCRAADVRQLWALLGSGPPGPQRTVPIIVGPAAPARWSIQLDART